eukprot:m.102432 g.102432  ORF g.102432 m.102432 type:complete len:557 (+) comp16821_c1_seq2:219-1889(+)
MATSLAGHATLLSFCLLTTTTATPISSALARESIDFQAALTVGDVNILAVTDVHGWVSGHRHNDRDPPSTADYGDLVSFHSHVQDLADAQGKDILLVNSGDIVDGHGLSDATKPKGTVLFPLLAKVPFDAFSIGNHELYQSSVTNNLADSGFIGQWRGKYLTSNVLWAEGPESGKPLGDRYTVYVGKNSGVKVLLFGFLYDFTDASSAVTVPSVESTIKENWFREALRSDAFDAVVVLAHMDLKNKLVYMILSEIRNTLLNVPVSFHTGHTHYRGYQVLDDNAVSLESGHFFDTVGWLAMDLPLFQKHSPHRLNTSFAKTTFKHEFVDANVDSMAAACGVPPDRFSTIGGDLLKVEIKAARALLGLDNVLGCAPQDYKKSANYLDNDSIWKYRMESVIPTTVFSPARNTSQVFMSSTGSIRYDIYKGTIIRDDCFTISPFTEPYWRIPRVAGRDVKAVISNLLNSAQHDNLRQSPLLEDNLRSNSTAAVRKYVYTPYDDEGDKLFDILAVSFDVDRVAAAVETVTGRKNVERIPFRQDDIDSTTIWEKFFVGSWPC